MESCEKQLLLKEHSFEKEVSFIQTADVIKYQKTSGLKPFIKHLKAHQNVQQGYFFFC